MRTDEAQTELPGVTPRSPDTLLTATPLAGEIGGIRRPFGRHQVVAYPARHDHIKRDTIHNSPPLPGPSSTTCGCGPGTARKPRLHGHYITAPPIQCGTQTQSTQDATSL